MRISINNHKLAAHDFDAKQLKKGRAHNAYYIISLKLPRINQLFMYILQIQLYAQQFRYFLCNFNNFATIL